MVLPSLTLQNGGGVCRQLPTSRVQSMIKSKPVSELPAYNRRLLSGERRILSEFSSQALQSRVGRRQSCAIISSRAKLAQNPDQGRVIRVTSDVTLIVHQEKLEISNSVRGKVSGSKEIQEASTFNSAGVSQDLQLKNDTAFVGDHYGDKMGGGKAVESSEGNSGESITNGVADGELSQVDTVSEKRGGYTTQALMPQQMESLHQKNDSLGVREGFVSKPEKRSVRSPMKEAFSGMKRIFEKDREVVIEWARNVRKRTGVDRVVAKDVGALHEAVSWVKQVALPDLKKEVTEIVAMRILEDPSAIPSPPGQWPQPKYHERRGKELLAADLQTLSSYRDHVKELLGAWRVPLQLSYNPDHVASYFNKRPHVLLFRFLEVAAAFSSVAVQYLIDREKVTKGGLSGEEEHLQYTLKSAEALKNTLLGLGPTFIKVAQSLSCRPDLIGNETAKVLSELQDRLAPFPTEDALAVIEEELGVPVGEVFAYLSQDPVAAASFGQVYKGRTVDGEEVAVKVQRPDLLYTVARDIYILRLALGLVRKVAKMNSDIAVLADELGQGLFGELNYMLEAANAQTFQTANGRLPYLRVPRTLPHLTSQRVLTMEWIDGFRPKDLQWTASGGFVNGKMVSATQQREAKIALDSLVAKGVESSLVQVFETGVMHADPHPGNMLFTKEGHLTYLDFGLICRMNKQHQAAMLAAVAHLVNGEWGCLADDLGDMDVLKPTTDRFALRLALERVFGYGPDAVVKNGIPDIKFGQVTGKLWDIAVKFRLRLPPYYTLVLRSLASLEGMAIAVDPDYKVFESSYPYVVTRLLTDNSLPTRQVLHSLVLNEKKQLRWERIASIVKTSQKKSSDAGAPSAKERASRKNMSVALLSFALSRKGTCVRRVLVEADARNMAEGFISGPASSLRREIANVLSEALYASGLNRLNTEQEQECSTSSSNISSEDQEEQSGVRQDFKKMLLGVPDISPETLLKNRRLWFVVKVLAGKLKGSPVLTLKVGWMLTTMVCYAAAIALHRIIVKFSDRLVTAKPGKAVNRKNKSSANAVANCQVETSLSVPALV